MSTLGNDNEAVDYAAYPPGSAPTPPAPVSPETAKKLTNLAIKKGFAGAGFTDALRAWDVKRVIDLKQHQAEAMIAQISVLPDVMKQPTAKKAAAEPARRKLSIIRPADWIANPPPDPEFLVPGWLPTCAATVLYGRGGAGKSLLAQELMTAGAIGGTWLGLNVEPFRSYALFSEDNEASLHFRQQRLCAHYGTDLGAITAGGMTFTSGVGEDVTLMEFTRDGKPVLTPLFEELSEYVLDHKARLLVLDTAARVFGGNENARREVTAFLGIAATRLAVRMKGSVLVLAHPSRSGEQQGHTGASTAWRGSARSLWILGAPNAKHPLAGIEEARLLKLDKLNDGPANKTMALRLSESLFFDTVCVESEEQRGERVFLAALAGCDSDDKAASGNPRAGNYAPRVFASGAQSDGLSLDTLAGALERLQRGGKVSETEYQDGSRHTRKRLTLTAAGRVWLTERQAEVEGGAAPEDPDAEPALVDLL